MPIKRFSIKRTDIEERVRFRLTGGQSTLAAVIWERSWEKEGNGGNAAVLIQIKDLKSSIKRGWLLFDIPLETDKITPARKLQMVFYIGTDEEGGNLDAAVTLHTANEQAEQLANRWGKDLQRLVWDGVLDCIEASIQYATSQFRNQPLQLMGYTCADDQLHIDIQIGA